LKKASLGCPNVRLFSRTRHSNGVPAMSKQLTPSDRAVLAELLQLKVPKQEIARRLHKHRSTMYRELKRNSGPVGYVPEEAQQRTDIRRWVNHRVRKMSDPQIQQYVCQRLRRYWSPDQIAGRSRREFRRQPKRQISRQTIYEWIRRRPMEECRRWRRCLRFGRPRRTRRKDAGRLPNAVRIEGRPAMVAARRRYGDWEGDTIVGRGRRGGLLSLVERKSGFTLLARVQDRRAATVRCAAEEHLAALPDTLLRTMTFDNGKEFAEHERLSAATGLAIYFAQPYAAWQRGTNENTNGLVRQYVPKGTDLTATSHHMVAAIQSSLNDRPRKRLGYRTPSEVLQHHARRHGVAFDI
jgi:transposase, IS30 family